MLSARKCPKCDNEQIAGPHKLQGKDSHRIRIDLPGLKTAMLESFTCTHCGYTELYSDRLGLKNIIQTGRFLPHVSAPDAVRPTQICSNCGAQINEGGRFCTTCGAEIMA